jgi:hypothetical protein
MTDTEREELENTEKRWEEGKDHHPLSLELMEHITRVDENNNLFFWWKYGGDGDNGEQLMYQMDSWFETVYQSKIEEAEKRGERRGSKFRFLVDVDFWCSGCEEFVDGDEVKMGETIRGTVFFHHDNHLLELHKARSNLIDNK